MRRMRGRAGLPTGGNGAVDGRRGPVAEVCLDQACRAGEDRSRRRRPGRCFRAEVPAMMFDGIVAGQPRDLTDPAARVAGEGWLA